MTYQMIAFDMDGTLLRSNQTIDPRSLEAIVEASRVGKVVVLSTGRSLSELRTYLPSLPSVRYGVLASGGLIYDFHEKIVLEKTALPASVVHNVRQLLQEEQVFALVMRDGQGYVQTNQFERISDYQMAAYAPLYVETAIFVDDLSDLLTQGSFEKINLYFATEEKREIYYSHLSNMGINLIRAEKTGLELSANGADKGEGLAHLCQLLGLDMSQVIAVGDADNDETALRRSGLGLAMGNANARLLSLADAVVSDHDNGGCAQAIRQYLLAN